ncbi:polysaccharide biosynthesis C-terminal domain-containing protein [Luminiphilus sp.]|nr:polysaccharide biosynthesis C-terminal domain-containing protein [Luminiphilus sp.]
MLSKLTQLISFLKNNVRLSDVVKLLLLALLKVMPPFGLLIISLYMVEVLTPSGYGSYAIVFNSILFMGSILTVGLSNTLLRKISVASAKGNMKKADKLFSASLFICSSVSVFSGLIYYLARNLFDFNNNFIDLVYMSPLLAISLIVASRVRGMNSPVLGQALEANFRLCLMVVFGIFFAFSNIRDSFIQEVYVITGGMMLAALYCLGGLNGSSFKLQFDYRYLAAIVRNALPNFLIILVQALKNHGDIFVVALFLGTSEVGEYAIALQLALISSIAPMIISLLFNRPLAVELHAENYSRVRQYFLYNVFASVAASTLYLLIIATLLPDILGIFVATEFEYVHSLTIILCVGRIIHAGVGPVMQILILSNQQSVASKVSGIIAVVNLMLVVIFVNMLGVHGAALSTAMMLVAWALSLRYAVRANIPSLDISMRVP